MRLLPKHPFPTRLVARAMTAVAALSMLPSAPAVVPAARAAPEPVPIAPTATANIDVGLQIVVFEAPGCLHCNLFRRYVLPAYTAPPRSRDVPMRFLDPNEVEADRPGLPTAIDMVPTAVLLHNHPEVGRISAYVRPEHFFHAVSHLLAQVD